MIRRIFRMTNARRLSENRKPTAEKRILVHFSDYIRSILQVFASFNRKNGLKTAFSRHGLYSRTAS